MARRTKAHVECFSDRVFPNQKGAIVINMLDRVRIAIWRGQFASGSLVFDHH